MSEACYFIFERDFYTLICKGHTESAQTFQQFCPYRNQDFFSAYLSHKRCCVHYLLALEACEHFMTLLIKAAQPENLFSLEMFFLYISNLCQPQKTLNRVTFLTEQRCSELQERKNQLAQKSDVVNSKVTACFSYIPTMLTNALPGAQWIRDMGTWQQASAQ